MGNSPGTLSAAGFDDLWRCTTSAPEFKSASREQKLHAFLSGFRRSLADRSAISDAELHDVVTDCMQQAASTPYSDAVFGSYLLVCKQEHPTAPDMDAIFEKEVKLDPRLWQADAFLSARPYVQRVLESADVDSFLSLLPKAVLRTVLVCDGNGVALAEPCSGRGCLFRFLERLQRRLSLLGRSLNGAMSVLQQIPSNNSPLKDVLHFHGNLIFGRDHGQYDFHIVAMELETGAVRWSSVAMPSHIARVQLNYYVTDDCHLVVHTRDDIRVFKPPKRHALAIFSGYSTVAMAGNRVFLMEPSKQKAQLELYELKKPDETHFTFVPTFIAKVGLPHLVLPNFMQFNIFAFRTPLGDIVLTILKSPDLVIVCYVDSGRLVTLDPSFQRGNDILRPLCVGNLLYFLDLSEHKRIIVHNLADSTSNICAEGKFLPVRQPSGHYFGIQNNHVVAVVAGLADEHQLASTYCIVEMEASTAKFVASKRVTVPSQSTQRLPFSVQGDYIIVGSAEDIIWLSISQGKVIATDKSLIIPRHYVPATLFFTIWGSRAFHGSSKNDELRCYKAASTSPSLVLNNE